MSFTVASFAVVALLATASSILTARLFGIEVVGEWALAMVPVGFLWLLSSVRGQAALVRELTLLEPRAPRVTALFVAILSFSTALTLVIGALAAGIAYVLFHGPIDEPGLFVPAVANIAGFVFVANVAFTADGVFAAFMAGRRLLTVRIHEAAAFVVGIVAFSFVTDSVWGPIAATYAAAGSALIHRLILLRPLMRFRVPRSVLAGGFNHLPEMVRFALKMGPGQLFAGLATDTGTWVLGVIGSVQAVGAYNRAWALARRIGEFNTRVSEMLLPTLVSRRAEGDGTGFDRALLDTMRYIAAAMFLIAAVGGGAAWSLMGALFGSDFVQGGGALAVLLVYPGLGAQAAIQTAALAAVDRPLATSVTAGAQLAVTFALTIPLTLQYGMTGTAAAIVAGQMADVLWKMHLLKPSLTRPRTEMWPLRQLVALFVAYGAAFATARVLTELFDGPVSLLWILPLAAAVYAVAWLVVGGMLDRDRERLAGVAETVRGRLARARATRAAGGGAR